MREVLDGRAWPTVEVEVSSNDWIVTTQVPAGLSKGTHEAFELRDGGRGTEEEGLRKQFQMLTILSPLRLLVEILFLRMKLTNS